LNESSLDAVGTKYHTVPPPNAMLKSDLESEASDSMTSRPYLPLSKQIKEQERQRIKRKMEEDDIRSHEKDSQSNKDKKKEIITKS